MAGVYQKQKFKYKLGRLKFLLVSIFFLTTAHQYSKAQNTYSKSIECNWQGIKKIENENEESFTIDLQNALYLPEFNYLPAREIDFTNNINDKVQLEIITKDTLSQLENNLLNQRIPENYETLLFRNISDRSSALLFPFIKDTTNGKWYKISTCKLHYQPDVPAKSKTSTNSRTGSTTGNSVLAEGNWFKLAVTQDNVYKIDRQFLSKNGIDVSSLDPRKIKIYGNGGGMLPQPNSAERPEGLIENAIYIKGEDDGTFNNNDYILFYGQSPHKLSLDRETLDFQYANNFYSDTTYYFIRFDGENGKRINYSADLGNSFPLVDTYDQIFFHENNDVTILSSGREWYGERIGDGISQNFNFQLPGLVKNSDITVLTNAIGQSFAPSTLNVRINNTGIGELNFDGLSDWTYATKGAIAEKKLSYEITEDNVKGLNITYDYNASGEGNNIAYINYFLVACQRKLTYRDEQLVFRSKKSLKNDFSTFKIASAPGKMTIWDVSNPREPLDQEFNMNDGSAIFGAETFGLKTFIAFDPQQATVPYALHPVKNQNLRGEQSPDLIIVSYQGFLEQARRLADFRENFNDLDVLVATPQQIYNEFSSGSPDPTAIRDFVKHMYDKGDQQKLGNLLLFGRCSYDYKNRVRDNTLYVPSYASRNSLNPLATYSSDDYFTFMDDDEGAWQESYEGDHDMDIGVGRLPVKTPEEAKNVVDKLIRYDSNPASYGNWRNEMIFVADDGDGNLHQQDAEKLSTLVDTTFENINVSKIYVGAYYQKGGKFNVIEAPAANKALQDGIDNGALLINYTGHGSETRWSSETIFDITTIRKLKNENHLPVFVTATCEFGRHDNPAIISGAELLLLNPDGGAIGMVCTARPVYASSNFKLGKAFYKNVFKKTEEGTPRDLGTVFKETKNASLSGNNNRNFSLLGDPSMRLAIPEYNVDVSEIVDDENPENAPDSLKALKKVKVKGTITDHDENILKNFNGTLTAKIFDKKRTAETLETEENSVMSYEVRDKIIYQGDVTVNNGEFETKFIVPTNIDSKSGNGKISLYAKDNLTDAQGSEFDFVIGGKENDPSDNTPPEMDLFINDTTFVEGGLTSSDIKLVAKLSDGNGINLLNDGVKGGLIVTLDDSASFDASQFFSYSLDSYQSGWLNYPFHDLSPGPHNLTLTAWDTHGNRSEANIKFNVSEYFTLDIREVKNYPNPFKDETTFTFIHSRSGEDLQINISVLSSQGRHVFDLSTIVENSQYKVDNIVWNKNSFSNKYLSPGVYIYKLSVRSLSDGAFDQEIKKLIVIN